MGPVDTYSQPDAPDPVLDDDDVLRLVRRHVPGAVAVRGVDESGGEARTYAVDDDIVFKTQRPHRLRPRTSLEKEGRFLDALGAQAGVPVPRNLGYGRDGNVEYLVLTRVPGVALANFGGDVAARPAALRALGHTLRAIHVIDQRFAADALFPGDTRPEDLRDRFATAFGRHLGSVEIRARWSGRLDLEAVAERALAATPADTTPVALHSNPSPVHVYVDARSGAFAGLIDFGDAYRSHPALDLLMWSGDDSDHVLQGYGSEARVPESFPVVRGIGLVLRQLNLVARGRRTADEAATVVTELVAGLTEVA